MTRINITDDMIERVVRVLQSETRPGQDDDFARWILESALDRRTGPKDRRVEWDDTPSNPMRRIADTFGRRRDDAIWHDLPRKSDRLKREAEEREKQKAREIHVSEVMKDVGLEILLQNIGVDRDTPTAVIAKAVATIYRAMRLQEMKERGQ